MPTIRIPGGLALIGGPTLKISVNGKIVPFEDHSYCGPSALSRRTGDPLRHQPPAFLKAATLWCRQGKRVENGLCVWDHEPEPITKHMGGPHYRVVGHTKPRRGS